MNFRNPMLAASKLPSQAQLEALLRNGPLLITPKWDGIRSITGFGRAVSRTLKDIPNLFIRKSILDSVGSLHVDGEIVLYAHDNRMCDFNTTQSGVMSEQGRPHFRYHIFDTWDFRDDYQGRIGWLYKQLPNEGPFHALALPEWAFDLESVYRIHKQHLEAGYEGSCARPCNSPYKHGRSTLREGFLLKLKPFADEEALVIGFTPLQSNQNEPHPDERGYTKRSKHAEGILVDHSRFGALICRNERWGEFLVGGGFTDLQRCKPEDFLHQTITYKYQPNHSRDKPHAAQFKSFYHAL